MSDAQAQATETTSDVVTEERDPRPRMDVVTSDLDLSTPAEPPSSSEPSSTGGSGSETEGNQAVSRKQSAPASGEETPPSLSADDDPRSRSAQKRIKALTGKAREAEAENLRLAAENEALHRQLEAQKEHIHEPQIDEFETPKEYARAYSDWEQSQQFPIIPYQENRDYGGAPGAAEQAAISSFNAQATATHGEAFTNAMNDPLLKVDDTMASVIVRSDKGAELVMHLADNPDLNEEIFALSRGNPALGAARLEALASSLGGTDQQPSLSAPADASDPVSGHVPAVSAQVETTAPLPADAAPRATAPAGKPDLNKASMEDYIRIRSQEEKQRMEW